MDNYYYIFIPLSVLLAGVTAYFAGRWDGLRVGREIGAKEAIKNLASSLDGIHYWFTGRPQIFNTLFILARRLKEKGGFLGADSLRDKVYGLGDKKYSDLSKEEIDKLV